MLRFQPVAFRPAVALPTVRRQALKTSTALGSPKIGQTFDSLFKWSGATGDLIRLAFHGTTAALGFHVWVGDKGFWKYFGLFLGIGQTIGAICDVISLGKRVAGTHPPEE